MDNNYSDLVARELTTCAASTGGMDREGAWIIIIASILVTVGFWLYHDIDAGRFKPMSAKLAGGYAVGVTGAIVLWALLTVFVS